MALPALTIRRQLIGLFGLMLFAGITVLALDEWDVDEVIGRGPGTAEQFFGGDLDGIIEHLDHIQALGVNTVYLTPVFPAAGTPGRITWTCAVTTSIQSRIASDCTNGVDTQ